MIKKILLLTFTSLSLLQGTLLAHCQMPCGIYHDDMVYDQVDQYVETMVKAMAVLNDNKFTTVKERSEFVRWVYNKEKLSDETAQLILTYFLQQKIKPGDSDTVKRVVSAHKLLFLLVQIKQNTDLKMVSDFAEEWEKFKLMFHIQGYECEMEKIKLQELKNKQEAAKQRQEKVSKIANDPQYKTPKTP